MYQAIVFLPLLGCIVAALISLAGARTRHPGADPTSGDDHAAGHGPHTGGAPSPHGDHAVIHHSDTEDHPHAPPAAGSRAAELVTTLFLFVAMVLSWIAFYRVGFGHQDSREVLLAWMSSGDLKVDWGIRVDTLTAVMLVVVTTVSAFVHLYSIGYMEEDPYRPRFFAYLSLFTFAMLMLVTSDNLVQMFFGWEGVGLASYLLIGFWYHKPEANAAAIKAFVVNRVGDNLLACTERDWQQLRGRRMSMVMQDPKYSLNPVKTVGTQIGETCRLHLGTDRKDAERRTLAMLEAVQIRDPELVYRPLSAPALGRHGPARR